MVNTVVKKPYQAKNKKYMLVSFGRMELLGWFEHNLTIIPKVPTRVVVKTDRGIELGRLVGSLCYYKAGQCKLSAEQIEQYYDRSQIDFSFDYIGKFIRYATAEDISEENHLQKIADEELQYCRRFIEQMSLPMKAIGAEHVFGGERIVFYFMAESRVDFRQLVKKLAQEYQTRIEMCQIGARDEAKLLGDVESCGQQCCCQRFLKALKPVNMRMAKMQKATLDPSKISGYCGRLKCCLRYEDQAYTELKKRLPKKDITVKTPHGTGRVTDTQILTQLVMVEHEGGEKTAVPLEDIEIISSPKAADKKQDVESDNSRQDPEETNSSSS